MVELSIGDEMLVVRVKGLHKLWAFKGSVEIPLRRIDTVRADPEGAASPEGIRNPGTCIPGLISVGTFNDGLNVLAVLDNRYDELVVEVSDPLPWYD